MTSKALQQIQELVKGQKVLYIASKNRDYLRLEQEISLLKKHAEHVDVIVSTKKNYILRLLYIYWKLLFYFHHYDIVFIGFAPQLVLPWFKWKFRNKKVLIDFFISLYDTFVFDRQHFNKLSWRAKILWKIDKNTLDAADHVICDTQSHLNYFNTEFGIACEKMMVLYLNADPKFYYPYESVKPEKYCNQFVVLYFGSSLPLQGINIIYDAIKRIDRKNIHFIMVGPYQSELNLQQTKKLTCINWLSQVELSHYISFSELCLAGHFSVNVSKAQRVIPGKAYIYEAMKKKMILGENQANRERYPEHYNNVLFVEMGNAIQLADLIMSEYDEWLVSHQNKNDISE